MELGLSNTLLAGDPRLVDHIVGEVKSQGIFDQFRKECIADVDTKPAYQNLRTRVEGSVNSFLSKQSWKPDLNKNQLRETLRKHIHDAPYLDAGVERIVDQVVNPKVYSVFMSQIEDVVYKFLGLERPKTKEKNGACGLKDLLPKDLDPVSPESDKNSLKDVSLESVDAMEDLEAKKDEKLSHEESLQEDETSNEKNRDNDLENGQISSEEKTLFESVKNLHKTDSNLNLNTSGKSDDKTEEEEEDSPTFEPIDIMNLNESNLSNDSHLSGISELTSHRSRSPDFCNELSRDNFDYSNQDSQLSKVSSDSRLSIVTDFGSSNHASTPIHDALKEEVNKDKCDVKNVKDNFKAVREYDSSKNKSKNIFELNKGKDVQDIKDSKSSRYSLSSKENSRDATDSSVKDKYEHKHRERSRDSESKSKSRDKNHTKDGRHHRDRSSDKKKQRSHNSTKYDKYDKSKSKEKGDQPKDGIDRTKDSERDSYTKVKEDKMKEIDKKDSVSKEGKDLKDLYKEKIRELREKKELTEKEKLNKDNKEAKSNKENKDKKDSPKDKKVYKKDHKSSSSKSSSLTSNEIKTIKSSDKVDGKEKRIESKDKIKRDERRSSKDIKSKNHISTKTESTEKLEKQDVKKISKNEKDEKAEKSEIKKDIKSSNEKVNGKKDIKNHIQNKSSTRNEKFDNKKESKNDSQNKDKKRREEKKSKSKDDHSSLRKNSNDRRSTDRDGSNGSSSKSSQSSNSSSSSGGNKSSTSTLSKESNHMSNSGSETSDNIEEIHTNDLKLPLEQPDYKLDHVEYKTDNSSTYEVHVKQESESNDVNLPLKKRPLLTDVNNTSEVRVKKPKFAKNIHEAKKLMKIRKQIGKQKLKENKKIEKKLQQKVEPSVQSSSVNNDNFESVPDEERVQIIEIPDEEYEEPYPENYTHLTLEERSIMMLQSEAVAKDLLEVHSDLKIKLSDMELCIQKSLCETLPTKILEKVSLQQATTNVQTGTSNNENKNDLQNEKSPSTMRETTKSNILESQRAHDLIGMHSEKKEVRQEVSTFKLEKSVTCQEGNSSCSITEENSKEKVTNQPNTSKAIVHNTNRLKDEKEIEIPTMSASRYEDNCQAVQNNSYSKVCTGITEENYLTRVKNEFRTTECILTEDNEDCRYFKADNEKSEKFSNFLESLELVENSSLEDIIESLGGQVISSMPKAMAPPLPKRKHSTSPLSDILLNNSNNNNDGHKKVLNIPNEDVLNSMKKRKLLGPKKQRLQANTCAPQGLLNGENFVMPLSPESDVSATSEKIPSSNLIKEDKGRHRSSQRYSSDDLYKPRPLFASSSRRSRRSNQA
ncbi:PREDICTED: biorientation of chromosomes in cell division protein 1-like 1 [Dufourea novaeangliae]|uniref:biorientation of chromosomes in cell division protein 1-like 1 n=1 Tax=Dufourea novaeangliae TaxID=178035 RepID=UPI000767D266|nr:PREDICTED: biorientation of chromosomes in cell division protein 1-like 1 [Dufourea novaeangliae]